MKYFDPLSLLNHHYYGTLKKPPILCECVKFILTPPRHCPEKDPVMTSSLENGKY